MAEPDGDTSLAGEAGHSDRGRAPLRDERLRSMLIDGAAALGVALTPSAAHVLIEYITLMRRWARAYNLTAVREPRRMVSQHLLDSLAILPFVEGPRVLDVGSGAGLPGIPLAVARRDWTVTLLDSNGKKVRFLRHAVTRLGITNTDVVQERAERYRPADKFDTLVSRAVMSAPKLIASAGSLVRPGGRVILLKGRNPESEVDAMSRHAFAQARIERLHVPGVDADRHLVVITTNPA